MIALSTILLAVSALVVCAAGGALLQLVGFYGK